MNDIRGLITGLFFAIITIAFISIFPKQEGLVLAAIVLACIGAIYLGFAIGEGKLRELLVQGAFIIFIFATLLIGLLFNPFFLAAGYFAHGFWDLIHHSRFRIVNTKVPELYIHACMLYDWTVGAFIVVWWK